jgi:transposase
MMSNQRYSAEFRDEGVRQVLDRGYSVKEVSERVGVSWHSLYKWVKTVRPTPERQHDEELLEAKREILSLRARSRRVVSTEAQGSTMTFGKQASVVGGTGSLGSCERTKSRRCVDTRHRRIALGSLHSSPRTGLSRSSR